MDEWSMRLHRPSGWQPIETAPKDGTLIDLWVDGTRLPDCRWYAECAEWEQEPHWAQKYAETGPDCGFPVSGAPTHWMPQPEPPTSGGSSPMDA